MSKRDFYDFYKILETLRGENGCPWDRAQTHESLKKCLIEEAYEAAEAIDTKDGAKMADELGDVLLQVVMHSLIGKENGEFDIDDVTEAASEKMVSRHPHIFGTEKAENPDEVLDLWENVKAKQRGDSSLADSLDSVSKALPSVTRAAKLQKKAAKKLCPDYPLSDDISLFKSLAQGLGENATEEECADIFFMLVRIVSRLGYDSEDILRQKNENFLKKIKNIEKSTCNNEGYLLEYIVVQSKKLWL